MTLLNSERVLSRIDTGNGELVLTSHRVLHGWETEFTSIMLEEVGSVVVARLTHRWLLVMTGTCVAMSGCLVWMALTNDIAPIDSYRRIASALLFMSAFLVMAFGIKRFSKVNIASPGATISFRIRSQIRREISRFVRDLENAKSARFLAADRGVRADTAPAQRPGAAPLQRRIG